MSRFYRVVLVLVVLGLVPHGFGLDGLAQGPGENGVLALVGARIIDGSGAAPIADGVMVVQNGRISAIGPSKTTTVPAGATRMDVAGKTIMPGLINAHGHITDVRGMKGSPEFYTPEHIKHQLGLYARYGVTTVFSLGGDGAAGVQVRDEKPAGLARLFVAGPVVSATDPAAARRAVDEVKALKADIVKIRVDDNLGTAKKMPAEAYRAVIDQAHKQGLKLAAHIFYLEDAKDILSAGGDFIAHSVRDVPVDKAFIDQLTSRDVCLCPTLMREVSTFVYESRPAFLDDPFFKQYADAAAVEGVQTPQHQATNKSAAATRYKAALEMAKANLKRLKDAGVRIAMGTDTGPAARFQGYFEHLELEHMVSAGLTPMQVIVASTSDAARCMNVGDRIGTLKPGLEADFLVLARNPLDDIRNTRSLESAWVRGQRVAR
jgi:imidazolonepropionase-like amidohydrolase